MIREDDYSLKQLQEMARSQGVSSTGTKKDIISRLKKPVPTKSLPATKKGGSFVIGHDHMGNLIITHTERTGEVFLQFESDRQVVYDLLKKWELKEVEKGYSVQVKDTEPRASILDELWGVSVQPQRLPQTSRDPVIEKGRQYWSKVNATQKAILDRMNAGTILEVHSDGDLTFEAEGRKYVLTTGGELFVGTPEYHPDHKGILPRTAPSAHEDLKYYKVPPSAF